MDTKISKYKLSAKRSKTAYVNKLNTMKNNLIQVENSTNLAIDRFKKNIINPNNPQMKIQKEYAEKGNIENATNIKTIEVFINELLNYSEPKIQKKMKEKEIENLYNDLKEEYSKIYNQCKTKILNESINTKEENLRSFEDLDEQEKANIESTTEIQKFMRAFNSKQGTQKKILENQARKEIQGEQERKKHKKKKPLIV